MGSVKKPFGEADIGTNVYRDLISTLSREVCHTCLCASWNPGWGSVTVPLSLLALLGTR